MRSKKYSKHCLIGACTFERQFYCPDWLAGGVPGNDSKCTLQLIGRACWKKNWANCTSTFLCTKPSTNCWGKGIFSRSICEQGWMNLYLALTIHTLQGSQACRQIKVRIQAEWAEILLAEGNLEFIQVLQNVPGESFRWKRSVGRVKCAG